MDYSVVHESLNIDKILLLSRRSICEHIYICRMAEDSSAVDSVGPEKEEKLIVFKSCLFRLLDTYPLCSGCSSLTESNVMGIFWSFNIRCSRCEYMRIWSTQPLVSGIPGGNLALSEAIIFLRASPSKFLRALKKMRNVSGICDRTYLNHNKLYVRPTVYSTDYSIMH